VADEGGLIFRPPLIVDISVGTLHGIPQPGETRMKEPQPPHAGIYLVTLEDADTAEGLSIGLPVIEDHEADEISASNELMTEENLLAFGAANV